MKLYPRLMQKLLLQPIALRTDIAMNFVRHLTQRANSPHPVLVATEAAPTPKAETRTQTAQTRRDAILEIYGSVAVIRIEGVIDKAVSEADLDCYGGCDLDDVTNALAAVDENPSIDTIVLYLNTPGGSVIGLEECAERIAAMRETHEIHAFFDVECCSAGYYLASQCDWIASTPSAFTGSIGTRMLWLDESKALEKEGITVHAFASGKFKLMGASFKPPTDEEAQMARDLVNRLSAEFKAAATSLRQIPADAMEGQAFQGRDALAFNAVDEVINCTLDEYVSNLMTR